MHKEKIYKQDYSNNYYNEEAFLNEFSSTNWSNLLHGLSDTTKKLMPDKVLYESKQYH